MSIRWVCEQDWLRHYLCDSQGQVWATLIHLRYLQYRSMGDETWKQQSLWQIQYKHLTYQDEVIGLAEAKAFAEKQVVKYL